MARSTPRAQPRVDSTEHDDTPERREALDETLPGNQSWRVVVRGLQKGCCNHRDFTSEPSHYEAAERGALGPTGSFSDRIEVMRCKETGESYVAKVVRNRPSEKRAALIHERRMLRRLGGAPHVISLYHSMETAEEFYLVLEKFDCDMHTFIDGRRNRGEAIARLCMSQLLPAMAAVHSKGIIHCDVKVENMLVREAAGGVQIALSDFGSARRFDSDDPRDSGVCGSGFCTAPEVIPHILGNRFTVRTGFRQVTGPDMWGIGMALHMLLTGAPHLPRQCLKSPRTAADWDALLRANGTPIGPRNRQLLRGLPAEAVDLLRGLLRPFPHSRLTAAEAMQHEWIATFAMQSPLSATPAGSFV